MMGKSFSFPFRGEILTLAVCAVLSVVLMILPADTRILVADRLGLVLTSPYYSVRNFGQDVFRIRDQNAWLQKRVAELELLAATGERMQHDAGRMAGPALDPGYDGDLVPCRVVMRQRARFATMIKIHSLVPVNWRPWWGPVAPAKPLSLTCCHVSTIPPAARSVWTDTTCEMCPRSLWPRPLEWSLRKPIFSTTP